MSSVQAFTENINFSVRIASFYELNSTTQESILRDVSNLIYELGKKHDFLVWRVSLDVDGKK